MTDPVHVVNGDSVEHTLAHSGLPGAVIVWRDVLHEGDVPPGDPAAVREARAAFLAGSGYGSREPILAALAEADAALVAALDEGRETVLWFEHDLHDQLQLIQILSRIAALRDAARAPDHARQLPGRPGFAGPRRALRRGARHALAAAAADRRDAYRDRGGRAFGALQRVDAGYLAAAARRLAPDRPMTLAAMPLALPYLAAGPAPPARGVGPGRRGLGRSERQILRAVAAGARTPAEVFFATQAHGGGAVRGDTWIFRRIDDLVARTPAARQGRRAGSPDAAGEAAAGS